MVSSLFPLPLIPVFETHAGSLCASAAVLYFLLLGH